MKSFTLPVDKDSMGVANLGYDGEVSNQKQDTNKKVGDVQLQEDNHEREKWSNPIEFLLSCVAMSVGLGNVWRFPFTAYENGGGAFLVPYLVVLLLVGKPLYYLELCLGQFSSYGPVKLWSIIPALRGIGYGQAIAVTCVLTYYVSLMGLTLYYFFASFTSSLPWATCSPEVENCIDSTTNISLVNISTSISSSEAYFEDIVLNLNNEGFAYGFHTPKWDLALCLLLSWICIFCILVKGVKSSGKAAYFTALFPYLVLFILLGRGVTLPGAVKGIQYFITPKWEVLLTPQVWYAAVSQSFFSLSVGFGSIHMFASYNHFRHNIYRDATILSVTDTLTSLLAGFTIFAILGYQAEMMGVEVADVIKGGGTGLAFVTYPDVISRFQWVPQLFAVLFFLMLFTLGAGSASALAASVITIICDDFPHIKKWIVTLVICSIGFLFGLFYVTPEGQYLVELIDYYGGTMVIYILTIIEVIGINWIYGYSNLTRDIEFMLNRKTGFYWRFCWMFFIPTLLIVVFIYIMVTKKELSAGGYTFGSMANGFGLAIVIVPILFLLVFFGVAVYKRKCQGMSLTKAIKDSFKTTEGWYPKNPILYKQYLGLLGRNGQEKNGVDNISFVTSIDLKPVVNE